MTDVVALIDRLINQHKVFIEQTHSIDKVASDATALKALEKAKEGFMPGRLEQGEGLKHLQSALDNIADGLRVHFNSEETGLLEAFKEYGDSKLVSTLNSLLIEHKDLRSRLSQAKSDVANLLDGKLARNLWQATANDVRAHLSHTWRLLEAHAEIENELFSELRRHFKN
jgi:hemerythrin-like domain-containing protein